MPDPYRNYRRGDPQPTDAATLNGFAAASRAERDRQLGRLFDGPSQTRRGDLVSILNETGANLDRLSIVGLDAPIFPPDAPGDAFLREVTFRGVEPTEDHLGKFAVLLEPASIGQVVRGWVSGVTPVRLELVDPSHQFADVTDGDTSMLTSSDDGTAQILWYDEGEAYGYYGDGPWAIVRLGAGGGGGGGSGYWSLVTSAIGEAVPTGYGGFSFGTGLVQLLRDNDLGTGVEPSGADVGVVNEVFEEVVSEGWYAFVQRRAGRWRLVTWRCEGPY